MLRKFTPPKLSPHWLRRDRLTALLTRAAERGLVFISAPAGSGKTVAVAQWLAGQRNKVAWLGLDRYDNEPAAFYAGLLGVLAQAQKANRTLHRLAEQTPTTTDPLEHFSRAMERALDNEKSYCLVLDDFHLIDNPEILAALPRVIARFPDNITLVVASRRQAPEPFAGLITKDQAAFLSAVDLKFTPGEVRALSRLLRHELDEIAAAELCRDVGGWPIGVGLRLMSAAEGNKVAPGGTESERRAYFSRFLEDHVWANWSGSLRNLLLKTALAPELEPALCAHMTGHDDCRALLEELVRENAFIAAMGDGRYRLHDLFREWLLRKWDGREYDRERPEVTSRLARWYHGEEKFFRAIDLYTQVGDFDGLARAMRDMSRYDTAHLAVESHLRLMRGLIRRRLPAEFVAGDPQLLALYAWGHFLAGDDLVFFRYVDSLRRLVEGPDGDDVHNLEAKFFMFGLDFRVPVLDCARSFIGRMPQLPPPPEEEVKTAQVNSITMNLPLAHRSMRDFSELVPAGEEGFDLLRATFGAFIGPDYEVLEACIRGGLHLERGESEAALRLAREAGRLTETGRSPEFYVGAQALLYLALRDKGETETAGWVARGLEKYLAGRDLLFLWPNFRALLYEGRLRDHGSAAAEEWLSTHATGLESGGPLSFYQLPRHFTTVRAHLAAGAFQTALLLLDRLRHLAERYRRPLDLLEAEILRGRALWRLGEADAAVAALDAAERLARPYGYTRLFRREMEHIAAPLNLLRSRRAGEATGRLFIGQLLGEADAAGPFGGPALSPRQRDLLRRLERNQTLSEIAEGMGLSLNTVKTHLKRIYQALGVKSRREAVVLSRALPTADDDRGSQS